MDLYLVLRERVLQVSSFCLSAFPMPGEERFTTLVAPINDAVPLAPVDYS